MSLCDFNTFTPQSTKLYTSPADIGRLIYFKPVWEGALFNLAKMVVSVLAIKKTRMQSAESGKAQVQEAGGHAVEDQKQIGTSNTRINHRRSVQMPRFTVIHD